ncbi:beta-lactamase/transpeptidase-like protein [Melanomma pulvis-pyrius CBS 109.77]|uniref:Beta-lactamase/transpeptidase-like protein n=1 Tax=Melanomma pulvis-pyrius CBS 109.77 TaxID=1314802 RepID=A0A6A6WZE0_9PLEO|nr:beta-lactamase/transpeptidase-like protein [Melanomma pulvis-pyrius CBS 109.77]
MLHTSFAISSLLLFSATSAAQDAPFSACPLLGPRFPILPSTATSSIIQQGLQNLTTAFDDYMLTGTGDFGLITPNTTSFSIALFSTETSNSSNPFLYEYHHTALTLKNSSKGVKAVDANSVYRTGDLTTLFTIWLFLIEAGEQYWEDPVSKWVPELASNTSLVTSISQVQWDKVTLGDLAANLGGIGRFSPTSDAQDSNLASLLEQLGSSNASSPCTTPIFSNAGSIILAYALESIRGQPFPKLFNDSIVNPLNMSNTSFLEPASSDYGVIPSTRLNSGWTDPLAIEAAFNGIYSSLADISIAFRAILSSQLLDEAVTQRWLKPVSLTSNQVNSIGRPWEIYSLTLGGPSPVIPIYQVRGNIGLYSSHVGLVPDYGVGFVILGADSESNPDMNAYADLISVAMIPALEKNAIVQASTAFSGTYTSVNSSDNTTTASLTIAQATDSTSGISLTNLTSGGTDIRAIYAKLNDIEPPNLSFRLYPTDLVSETDDTTRMAFRAIFQDVTELGDAGTPTCDTWRSVDALQLNGVGMDEFVFDMINGEVVGVEVPALGLKLGKEES